MPAYLDRLFDVGEDASRWLLSEVVPMTAQTTLALRRWGANLAAAIAHREEQVAALTAAFAEKGTAPSSGCDPVRGE